MTSAPCISSRSVQAVFAWALCALFCLAPGRADEGASSSANDHRSWRQYGGGPDQSKYVDLSQITKENVCNLEVAWVYAANNGAGSMFNPIVVDDVMYVLGKNSSLVALDAATGKELWVHTNLSGIVRRGINYWESKDRKDRRLIFCMRDTLQAIDAVTGKSIMSFGDHGVTSLKEDLGRDPATIGRAQSTTPGAIFENLILLGSSPGENYFSAPGHLRAYDVVTGKLAWVFHTIPFPGEYGYESWPKDAYKYIGGVNTWGEITVDAKRGIAYFPLGAPTYDYYGADRIGRGLYGDCLLALDARTGKRLWHYQMVHHDLWDYDACAAPQLITVQHHGETIDAIAQATKQGFLFVFDRVTGEPLWPIEERPVPASQMPGEKSWPTQPFPTVVPPFNRQNVTVDDVNPYFTDEQRERWRKRIAAADTGIFRPLSDQYETIAMPGAVGGANFGNTAANPAKGIVYVSAQELPSVYKLKLDETWGTPRDGRALSADQLARAKDTYVLYCQSCHGADRAGMATIPPVLNVGAKYNLADFKTLVAVGRGQMPGFPHIEDVALANLYSYLGGGQGRPGGFAPIAKEPVTFEGPIVGSGGALGDQPPPPRPAGRNVMRNYPDGVVGPPQHYSTGYGLEYPNLLSPPWSFIVAYDLNTGGIKWKRPLGQDPKIAERGGKETGIPTGSQRKGMIVTATGLVFASCLDGKIYAYDADDGKMLWSTQLPRVPEGLLSMFEVKGRQYLEVCSMAAQIDKSKEPALPAGYIVYALSEKKQ